MCPDWLHFLAPHHNVARSPLFIFLGLPTPLCVTPFTSHTLAWPSKHPLELSSTLTVTYSCGLRLTPNSSCPSPNRQHSPIVLSLLFSQASLSSIAISSLRLFSLPAQATGWTSWVLGSSLNPLYPCHHGIVLLKYHMHTTHILFI